MKSRPRHLAAAGAVVTLVLVAGCGGGGASPDEGLDPATLAQEVRDLAEQAKAQGFTEQYEILRDGAISDAEYRQAFLDGAACYERAGVRVEGPTKITTVNGYQFSFIHGDVDGEFDCESRFVMYANMGWSRLHEHVLTPEALAIATECFQREGVDPTGITTVYGFLDLDKPTFDVCLWEAAEAVADPPGEVIFGY